KASYLLSKIGLLFIISAIQTFLFAIVGDQVLGIQGMTVAHWVALFTTACFANVLGLNVSASFNSAKVIYIVIPVLIIPQLLFSGIIVRFDKLHPWFASEKSVPWIGNVMASRWAYEGMAVAQFTDNAYEADFYAFDQRMKVANWKKDLWVRDLQERSNDVRRALHGNGEGADMTHDLALICTELEKEQQLINGYTFAGLDKLTPERVDDATLDELNASLDLLTQHYRNVYRDAEKAKEARIAAMTATPELRQQYFALLDANRNESLSDHVTNKNDVNVIVEADGELVQKSDPIYVEPREGGFFGAHFYAPVKSVLGQRLPTLWANMILLWGMTALLAVALYADVFPTVVRRLGGDGSSRA
ncbi:MAG TPA: ABC transporter permease, partial [Flavobacteriales bacterium]|nr:ABC transporter permease [Flavobacteriales bacterium]